MRQPIPPQLEVAAAAAQGPDAGMERLASVEQPLDATHTAAAAMAQGPRRLWHGDGARLAPLQPLHAGSWKTPTSRLRARVARCRRRFRAS